MYTSNPSRPVIRYVSTSIRLDEREPLWWMRAQSRGMMFADRGHGPSAQQGDY